MILLVQLLRHRNHYMEKFYSLNEEQISRMEQGDFESIDEFYHHREQILEQVRYIDSRINEEMDLLDQPVEERDKAMVQTELRAKSQYVKQILDQDLKILALMDDHKSAIVRELQELAKGRKSISKYKSPQFNRHLDEEA